VLDTVEACGGRSVAVTPQGVIDLDALHDELVAAQHRGELVSLVSVMASNNEVGTVQPIAQVSKLVRELAPQAAIHVDAVNAMPWLDLSAMAEYVDLMAVSAHKVGGPKGVAALRVRAGIEVVPMLHGGGQERGRRSGTHNVAGIVGFAASLLERRPARSEIQTRVRNLRDRFLDELLLEIDDASATAPREMCTPSAAHVTFGHVEGESLLFLLDESGVAASAGSSCSSGALEPSHVLLAMGVPRQRALGALRLTLGDTTTDEEVDYALEVIPAAVKRLRDFRLEL
jgi:cysteine desulfurase